MTTETEKEDPGYKEVYHGLQFAYPEQFIVRVGMKGLNWIIQQVLDRHYPLDVFPQDTVHYGMTWGGEHGGDDIDPGVKWVAHLREALRVIDAPK